MNLFSIIILIKISRQTTLKSKEKVKESEMKMRKCVISIFAFFMSMQVMGQSYTAPDSPGAFKRAEYKERIKADPVKAIKYFCFDKDEEPLYPNENLFKHLSWIIKSSDDLNSLARDPGFRSDMEKHVIYMLDFIHSYDLGKISGNKAASCMLSLDALVYKIFENKYSNTWTSYYSYLAEEEKKSKQAAATKAQQDAYAKSPEGLLENIYSDYAFVKKCNELRQGSAIVYINENEFSKAKSNAKREEEIMIGKFPTLDAKKNEIWNKAAKSVEASDYVKLVSLGRFDNDFKFYCQAAYQRLNKSTQMKKDF